MHASNWKKKPLEVFKKISAPQEINSPWVLDYENQQFHFERKDQYHEWLNIFLTYISAK